MALFLVIVGLLTIIGVLIIGVIEARRPKRSGVTESIGVIEKRRSKRSDVAESVVVKTPRKETLFSNEVMAQLKKLGELKERGILTEEEFQRQKAKLLSHQT